jgi:ABC-type dipeptide/oligopeptide/nickel transport system permease component
MLTYLIVRLARWVTAFLLVLFVAYAMMYYGAGDPIKRMFFDQDDLAVDSVAMERIRDHYGLSDPFPTQFVRYLNHLAHGDMGTSIRTDRPVSRMVRVALPISFQIGLLATIVSTMIGIPLGVLAALRQNRRTDVLIVGLVTFVNAVPIFVSGPLLMLLLVGVLELMQVPWGWDGLFSTRAILPVFVLSMAPLPILVRQTRAAVLEVQLEDYIRTARAKGLPEWRVVIGHMLRPVLMPVVTSVGLITISLVNGSAFVELIFGIPGFGRLTLQGLQQVDYPVILATVAVGSMIVMVGNLLIDLIYPLLDPRIARTGR